MPVDLDKLQSIFLKAVEVEDAGERAALLDRECAGDAELRERVESLLAAHVAPGSLLEEPAIRPADATSVFIPEAVAGATIAGRYKLLEQIGEGGMGLVWMAEQRAPVRRLVAVKLIKAGMDSRSVLTRFAAERQALAMMDHPSIARVFDGGTTDRGHPWFAMELVRGLPVTHYSDDRRLSVADRLALFMQICSAVQHAHQKGIIHRDLKPSNVLVTEHDGRPVPKVIDFGLAKALGGATILTEHTLYTSFGAAAGTPLYMAPEQVAINALDVDTRADVYALGVLLYELLTGTTPLERQQVKDAAWDEIRRVIREVEPPRPSLRISTSEALPTLAATRQIEPAKLSGLLRGDLDWIVLKALEKDRNRRYESAASLSADIGRHLADEPVVAAPPTLGYRAQKYFRKHRGPVIAASAVAAALILGIVGTSIMTLRYRSASADAIARADSEAKARDSAELDSYIANISAAQAALSSGGYPEARQRLDACPVSRRGWEWKYLREEAGSVVAVIPSRYEIREFTPDGTRMVLSSSNDSGDGIVEIWDMKGRPVAQPIKAGEGRIRTQLSSDGTRLLTASDDGIIGLWDLSGRPLHEPVKTGLEWYFPILSPDGTRGLSHVFKDRNGIGVITLWDDSGKLVEIMERDGLSQDSDEEASNRVNGYEWCRDGKHFITTTEEGTRQLWNADGTPRSAPISPSKDDKNAFGTKFSLDGTRLLKERDDGSDDGSVVLCDIEERELARLDGSCEFSPDGRFVLANMIASAQLWDRDGNRVGQPMVGFAEFSPDGSHLLSDSGSTVRVLDTKGRPVGEPILAGDSDAKFSEDGKLIVVYDRLFNLNGTPVGPRYRYTGYGGWKHSAISSDGSRLITSDPFRLWTVSGLVLGIREGSYYGRFTPDGQYVLLNATQNDYTPTLILSTAEFISPTQVAFAKGARTTAHGSVWTARDAEQRWMCESAKSDGNLNPAISANDRHPLVRIADGGVIEIMDANGDVANQFVAHQGPVATVALSADGHRLVTGGQNDGMVRFWDTKSWREVATVNVAAGVKKLEFSPDDQRLILSRADGALEIWDARSSVERRTDLEARWADRQATRPWATRYVDEFLSRSHSNDDAHLEVMLARDKSLTSLQQVAALDVMLDRLDDMDDKCEAAWDVVSKPDHTPEELANALNVAQEAVRLVPDGVPHLRALGVAQYRAGLFQDAIQTLDRSTTGDRFNYAYPAYRTTNQIVQAMAAYRLGDLERARMLLLPVKELYHEEENLRQEALRLISPPTADEVVTDSNAQSEPVTDMP